MWKCPVCNAESSGNVCASCGHVLDTSSVTTAQPSVAPEKPVLTPKKQQHTTVSAGNFLLAVKNDGTVLSADTHWEGFNLKYYLSVMLPVRGWKDIVSVAQGYDHVVGLKADGTVVAAGSNARGQCKVSDWMDVVAIAAEADFTIGLKSDGTVVSTGDCADAYALKSELSGWCDIVSIALGESFDKIVVLGLKSDGTVVAAGRNSEGQCDVSEWKDTVSVVTSGNRSAGLKSDGTVVVTGENEYNLRAYRAWTDVVAIALDQENIVALKSDGTIEAYGGSLSHRDVEEWTDIAQISAGNLHVIGLCSDGTVRVAGKYQTSKYDVIDWSNVVSVITSPRYSVGLTADGTLQYVGERERNFSHWKDLRVLQERKIQPVSDQTHSGSTTTRPKNRTIAVGENYVLALREDGTVLSGLCNDQKKMEYNLAVKRNVAVWENIVSVAVGKDHVVGLKVDGSVETDGTKDVAQRDVLRWKKIVDIAAGDSFTIGLKADGTVVTTNDDEFVQSWKNIVEIVASHDKVAGLRANGTVVLSTSIAAWINARKWTDIVDIALNGIQLFGVKADGTVVYSREMAGYAEELPQWTDIIRIAAGKGFVVGLRKDGTLIATKGADWPEIHTVTNVVDIAADDNHIMVLQEGGTAFIHTVGNAKPVNTSHMKDIWVIQKVE